MLHGGEPGLGPAQGEERRGRGRHGGAEGELGPHEIWEWEPGALTNLHLLCCAAWAPPVPRSFLLVSRRWRTFASRCCSPPRTARCGRSWTACGRCPRWPWCVCVEGGEERGLMDKEAGEQEGRAAGGRPRIRACEDLSSAPSQVEEQLGSGELGAAEAHGLGLRIVQARARLAAHLPAWVQQPVPCFACFACVCSTVRRRLLAPAPADAARRGGGEVLHARRGRARRRRRRVELTPSGRRRGRRGGAGLGQQPAAAAAAARAAAVHWAGAAGQGRRARGRGGRRQWPWRRRAAPWRGAGAHRHTAAGCPGGLAASGNLLSPALLSSPLLVSGSAICRAMRGARRGPRAPVGGIPLLPLIRVTV